MKLGYFSCCHQDKNRSWLQIAREERAFCAELYHALQDPGARKQFLRKLIGLCALDYNVDKCSAEIAFEACFYRDMIWDCGVHGQPLDDRTMHALRDGLTTKGLFKRTFDLIVFLERDIIVIEAKVHEGFSEEEMLEYRRDLGRIKTLVKAVAGIPNLGAHLVGLATSAYWSNCRPQTKSNFCNKCLSWADMPLPQKVKSRIDTIYAGGLSCEMHE